MVTAAMILAEIRRYSDWPRRLEMFIEYRKTIPFRWGKNDCCLFAADAIESMTGVDLAREFRGTYKTELGAMRHLLKEGSVFGIACRIARNAGIKPCAGAMAGRGDVVYVKGEQHALGVVGLSGDSIWILTVDGLGQVPLSRAVCGWHI